MSNLILKKIFKKLAKAGTYKVKLMLANKSEFKSYSGDTNPDLSVIFHTVWAQWRTIIFFPVGFIDAYIDGDIDLEGDRTIYKLAQLGRNSGIDKVQEGYFKPILGQNVFVWFLNYWYEKTQDNINRERTIENARFHYSLPVELFKYKLGETIGYSEGYWPEGTETLNQAKNTTTTNISARNSA